MKKMKQAILNIISNKKPIYFISPHLDDAIFSCGDLISYLAKKTTVYIVTIFTDAGVGPYSYSAKIHVKRCGFKDIKKLFYARKMEDISAMEKLGVEFKHLGLIEAQLRKNPKMKYFQRLMTNIIPEAAHVYPVYRWHVINGKISHKDLKTLDLVIKKLKSLIGNDSFVFCPLAVGNHVDHVIVRNCCIEAFKNVILWSDFPYNRKNEINFPGIKKHFEWKVDERNKLNLMKIYKTQFEATFPNGNIDVSNEKYFINDII